MFLVLNNLVSFPHTYQLFEDQHVNTFLTNNLLVLPSIELQLYFNFKRGYNIDFYIHELIYNPFYTEEFCSKK